MPKNPRLQNLLTKKAQSLAKKGGPQPPEQRTLTMKEIKNIASDFEEDRQARIIASAQRSEEMLRRLCLATDIDIADIYPPPPPAPKQVQPAPAKA